MPKRTTLIIHYGTSELPIGEALRPDFRYVWVSDQDMDPLPNQPLIGEDGLNSKYRNAYFIIDGTCEMLMEPDVLRLLPANQLLVGTETTIAAAAQELLAIKGAITIDLRATDQLIDTIKYNFFGGMNGYKVGFDQMVIDAGFTGKQVVMGQSFRDLTGDFGAEWNRVAYLNEAVWVPADLQYKFIVEFDCPDQKVQLRARFDTFNAQTSALIASETIDSDDLRTRAFEARGGANSVYVQLTLLARGQGELRLGQVHVRRSRGHYGELLVNGGRLIEPTGMNGELDYYFDAGDLRPPLNVYFSGWAPKESFEGNFMMRGFGSPFILIADRRLEGGSFYVGSPGLEQQVVDLIRQTLARLHFDEHDLILSGLSMGTFASLYYAGRLSPFAVVIGKPLTNLGTIAANGRIKRPADFATATDMLLTETGQTNTASVAAFNERFWNQFKAGRYDHTTFAITYMEDDDYDQEAFTQLREWLKERYPYIRLLSKGLPGRHNDDTSGIVNWFVMQYRYLLTEHFNRHYD